MIIEKYKRNLFEIIIGVFAVTPIINYIVSGIMEIVWYFNPLPKYSISNIFIMMIVFFPTCYYLLMEVANPYLSKIEEDSKNDNY